MTKSESVRSEARLISTYTKWILNKFRLNILKTGDIKKEARPLIFPWVLLKKSKDGKLVDATKAKDECRRFIKLLRDKLGVEPDGASLVIKANQHDFGTYYEVACKFDMNNKVAVDWAFNIETNLPLRWS